MSISRYQYIFTSTNENKTLAQCLVDNGYYNGYSNFWGIEGNALTELTDGKLEIWNVNGYGDKIDEPIFKWLQYTSHADTLPQGKVFLLIPAEQYENYSWKELLNYEQLLYQSDNFRAYGFEDYYHIPEEIRSH